MPEFCVIPSFRSKADLELTSATSKFSPQLWKRGRITARIGKAAQ